MWKRSVKWRLIATTFTLFLHLSAMQISTWKQINWPSIVSILWQRPINSQRGKGCWERKAIDSRKEKWHQIHTSNKWTGYSNTCKINNIFFRFLTSQCTRLKPQRHGLRWGRLFPNSYHTPSLYVSLFDTLSCNVHTVWQQNPRGHSEPFISKVWMKKIKIKSHAILDRYIFNSPFHNAYEG